MSHDYAAIAKAYYTAIGEKNVAQIEKYVDPKVHFIGPLNEQNGKEALIDATTKFANLFKTLKIRAVCNSGNQASVFYDVEFPNPIGLIRTAALLTFHEGLITKIEVIFDPRPFVKG